MFTEFEHQLKK